MHWFAGVPAEDWPRRTGESGGADGAENWCGGSDRVRLGVRHPDRGWGTAGPAAGGAPVNGFQIAVEFRGNKRIRPVLVKMNLPERRAADGESRAVGERKILRAALNADQQAGFLAECRGQFAC